MAYSNISGSHKLKLICIGQAKKPRSFKGTEMRCFPVVYYNQPKAWMNQDIFRVWLYNKFFPQCAEICDQKLCQKK